MKRDLLDQELVEPVEQEQVGDAKVDVPDKKIGALYDADSFIRTVNGINEHVLANGIHPILRSSSTATVRLNLFKLTKHKRCIMFWLSLP
jgi:hypothetical protein